MNPLRVDDPFDFEPFDDTPCGGVLELRLPKKAATSSKRLLVG